MERAKKEQVVTQLQDKFNAAKIAVLTDFRGLNVEAITGLRRNLREENVEYRVVKNTLARIAVKGTPSEQLVDEFNGTVGVVFSFEDATAAPRILVDYMKTNKQLVLKVASFEGNKIDLDKIKTLASLPSKDQLLGQIAGLFAAPMRNMVNCLAGVPRGFLNCLIAIKEQKEKEGN